MMLRTEKNLMKQKNDRHLQALKDMKDLFDKKAAEITRQKELQINKVKEKGVKHGKKIMERAKESAEKFMLTPKQRKEARVKLATKNSEVKHDKKAAKLKAATQKVKRSEGTAKIQKEL